MKDTPKAALQMEDFLLKTRTCEHSTISTVYMIVIKTLELKDLLFRL